MQEKEIPPQVIWEEERSISPTQKPRRYRVVVTSRYDIHDDIRQQYWVEVQSSDKMGNNIWVSVSTKDIQYIETLAAEDLVTTNPARAIKLLQNIRRPSHSWSGSRR